MSSTGTASKEQEYRAVMNTAESAAEPRGRLELLMDECASSNFMAARSSGYVAFRRRGKVYALSAESMPAPDASFESAISTLCTAEERKYADRVAKMIESGSIDGAAFRSNGPADTFCISSVPYNPSTDSGRQYDVPEGAKWARARKRKIIFYGAEIPVHKAKVDDRRRKYFAVPENALKVRRILGRFEWVMPDCVLAADGESYILKEQ